MIRSKSSTSNNFSPSSQLEESTSEKMNTRDSTAVPTARAPGGSRIRTLALYLLIFSLVLDSLTFFSGPSIPLVEHRKIAIPVEQQITVVMNTFKRNDMMADAVKYYSQCDSVKYIYVVWSEKTSPPMSILSHYNMGTGKHPVVSE